MNVQQYILINAVLIAVFCVVCLLLKRGSRQEEDELPCDTCANLEIKRTRSFSDFKYECKFGAFDKCPNYCKHYIRRNTK